MKQLSEIEKLILLRTERDDEFRGRLLANPKETIESEFGVTLAEDHELHVYEDSYSVTHLILPPRSKFSEAERQEAKAGGNSLEFLRKTLHNPAPPLRQSGDAQAKFQVTVDTSESFVKKVRESIRSALEFLDSTVDEHGAWHCVRFNVADPNIPRHFEKPAFITAFCVLALRSSKEPLAQSLCAAARNHLVSNMEYPGLWRYYRHLPQDLDSTTVCSLVIADHPWIFLRRNFAQILANRDDKGCFMTWILDEDEPDVVSTFRIEADPVVNANVIAYLGDHPETRDAQRWLEELLSEGDLHGSSKWYPDPATICYAISRAVRMVQPALDRLRPLLVNQIHRLGSDEKGFSSVLQIAQIISALYNVDSLKSFDIKHLAEKLIASQRDDGSWPELLAFGDQSLKWGTYGQIGHGSESVTTAFCVEALERLIEQNTDTENNTYLRDDRDGH